MTIPRDFRVASRCVEPTSNGGRWVANPTRLDVIACEPASAHANIEGSLWLENDAELQKAQ